MKNLLGGLIGAVVGSLVIVYLAVVVVPSFPQPFDTVWFVLVGSDLLQSTFDQTGFFSEPFAYVLAWACMGLIAGFPSESKWNAMRSVLWLGSVIAVSGLLGQLILDPSIWTSNQLERNIFFVTYFIRALLTAFLALPTSVPVAFALARYREGEEPLAPDKIETMCECGAVFKSNPLICSECGKQLRE